MTPNADPAELARFSALAHRWWDPNSEFKALHDINPLRLAWIESIVGGLAGKRVVDVGCGGGILAESMASRGASVTGVDLSERALGVARLHQLESGVEVDYRLASAEALAQASPGTFDVVTCLEMLEHVPDAGSTVNACATLARPGGHVVFSTINRNPRSYALAIVGAEYILRWLPVGSHRWDKFVTPNELEIAMEQGGLRVTGSQGVIYNILADRWQLSSDMDVNYMLVAEKA